MSALVKQLIQCSEFHVWACTETSHQMSTKIPGGRADSGTSALAVTKDNSGEASAGKQRMTGGLQHMY